MSEKKNIVIKVKYPTSGQASTKPVSGAGIITEWDFTKIGLALGSLLLMLLSFFYFTGSDDRQADTGTQLVLPAELPESKSQTGAIVSKPLPSKANVSHAVVRAQLTSDIKKNEPTNTLKLPLKISKNETLWIYYFVELKSLENKTVYHEWWLNGNLVSRKKVNISDDPWRTASKQLITYTANNDWIVKVVDESRNTLTEKSFNLALK